MQSGVKDSRAWGDEKGDQAFFRSPITARRHETIFGVNTCAISPSWLSVSLRKATRPRSGFERERDGDDLAFHMDAVARPCGKRPGDFPARTDQPAGLRQAIARQLLIEMEELRITAPREFPDLVETELHRLRVVGHVASPSAGERLTYSSRTIGGAQVIRIDWQNGTLVGASESRKDGIALGY